jgi:DNA helicase INO80
MKGNEKRERESRKKAEKEALEKAKKEEDMREAQRQARKLNFLITQTELYSHFVGDKIKSMPLFIRVSSIADDHRYCSERSGRICRHSWCRPCA